VRRLDTKQNLALFDGAGHVNVGILGIAFVSIILGNYNSSNYTSNTATLFGSYEVIAVSIGAFVFFCSFLLWGVLKIKQNKDSLRDFGTEKNLRLALPLNVAANIFLIVGFYLSTFTVPREDYPVLSFRPYYLPGLIVIIAGAALFYKTYKVYKRVKNETIEEVGKERNSNLLG
jgi:hypothetical protein